MGIRIKAKASPEELIKTYNLKPHPEGGYFQESYRSVSGVSKENLSAGFHGNRPYSTAIYYLLPRGAKSNLHKIASDEIWHFYLGDALILVEILAEGRVRETLLGQDVASGQQLQYVVRAGTWFGAYLAQGSEYSFVGCTVAPGFDFADLEMANRETLFKRYPEIQYPEVRKAIERLT